MTIFFEGEPWRDIHQSIFGKKPWVSAPVNTLEDLRREFSEAEKKCVRLYLLRALSRKNYSSFELTSLLKERLVTEPLMTSSIEKLQSDGYINDQDWLKTFIRRYMRQNVGAKVIACKLRVKGVPEEVFKPILYQLEQDVPQSVRIQKLLETKYRKKNLRDFKEKQKVIASLSRKGFDYEQINEVLINYQSDV